ncbi:hypothetical protein ScPMuIL_008634 [Solemya velum]
MSASENLPIRYTSEQLLKDVTEIHARCFDHRPVLQGHISFFLKEFEEKRGERERARLEKTSVVLKKLNDILLPETNQAMNIFLTDITAKLQVATELCKKAEEADTEAEGLKQAVVEKLEVQREARRQNWENFMVQQCQRSARVDQEYMESLAQMKAHYADLEEKIKHPAPIMP